MLPFERHVCGRDHRSRHKILRNRLSICRTERTKLKSNLRQFSKQWQQLLGILFRLTFLLTPNPILPEHEYNTETGSAGHSPPDPYGHVFGMFGDLQDIQLFVTILEMSP